MTTSNAESNHDVKKTPELARETITDAIPKETVIEESATVSPSPDKPMLQQGFYVKILGLNWNVLNNHSE